MIGQIVTDEKGNPVNGQGQSLTPSQYQPPREVRELFAKVQADYQTGYMLQNRTFDEFDGLSLLQRSRLDQQTFAAYVGAEFVPVHKRWRFRGRPNTSRNKLIGILAHMLAGMLYPFVYAKNEEDEEDKMTARVMRILVEDYLRKADYEIKFLFMVLSALVNPATYVSVEYVEAMQRIKKNVNGKWEVKEVLDDVLSGLVLNTIPIDELLPGDYYSGTGNLQVLPNILRVRRISYDQARSLYAGKYFDDGKDRFDYVKAGQTRIVMSGQDNQTLFDVEWTEADANYVQEITAYYRGEDLQVTFVGGVFMGEAKDVYNANPFKHRRFCLKGKEWESVPVYPFAMTGFEPIDPAGRFLFFKSGAFKEYWDDQLLTHMSRIVADGTTLEVIKPLFMSGVANVDSVVIAPGAAVGMPMGATVSPWSSGPNLRAAYDSIVNSQQNISESTQDKIQSGVTDPNVTATASIQAERNARIFLGVFGLMIGNLIRQVGELTMDLVVAHATVGELDATTPESLRMKYNSFLVKGKDKGKDVTNKIVFTDEYMGREMDDEEIEQEQWDIYNKSGKTPEERERSDQRLFKVNPYKFARYSYTMFVDPDKIIMKSMGADKQEKILAFNMMSDPRVAPFTDRQAVVDDFVIEEFGGDNPDRYKAKETMGQQDMMSAVMNGQGMENMPTPQVNQPLPIT